MMQDYFVIPFTRLRKFPCIPCLLRVLIMNGFCILLNVFSASFEISIYFFFFNLLMWWITLIDIELTLYYGASSDLLHGSFCCMDILLYGILEWVAISFSRGSSPPRDWTQVSCIAGRGFTLWATGKQLRLRHVIFIYKLMYLLIFFFAFMFTNKIVPWSVSPWGYVNFVVIHFEDIVRHVILWRLKCFYYYVMTLFISLPNINFVWVV